MPRRTHSTIDTLPAEVREAITSMIVDAAWPEDYPPPPDYSGRPRYEDVVTYCQLQGWPVSSSAVGRWAKGLLVLETMRNKTLIVRNVMKDITQEKTTETQKAAAEIMTAKAIDFALEKNLSAIEFKNISRSVRDCAAVSISADKYYREQIGKKLAASAKSTKAKLKKAGVDRKLIQEIIDEHLGVVKS